jgi:hypothetical protein
MSSKRSIGSDRPKKLSSYQNANYLERQSSMKQLPVIDEYLEQPPPPPLAGNITPSPPSQKRLRKSTSEKDFFDINRNSEALSRLSRISEEAYSRDSAADNIQGLDSAALSFPNKPEESFVPPPLVASESIFPREAVPIKSERQLSKEDLTRHKEWEDIFAKDRARRGLFTKEDNDLINKTAESLNRMKDEFVGQQDVRVDDTFKYYNEVYKPELAKKAKMGLSEYRAQDFDLYGSREFDKIAFENYKKSVNVKDKLTAYELNELEQKVLGDKSATEIEFEKVNEANIGLQTKAKIINFVGVVLGGLSGAAIIPVVPFLAPVMGGTVVILFFCNTLAEKYKSKLSLRNLVNDLSNICLRIYQTIDNINKSISNEDDKTKLAFNDVSTLADLNNSLRDVYVYIMSLLDEPELQIMSTSYDNKKKEGLTETESFILNLIDDEIKIRRGGSQMNRAKRAIGFRIFNSSDFTLRITSLMTKLNSNLILYYNNFLAKGIMDNKVIIKFNQLQDITSKENNAPINLMTSAINITPGMVRDFRARRNELVDNITLHTSGIAKTMFEGYSKFGVNPFKKTVQNIRSTFKWGKGGHKNRITKKQRQKGKQTYKRKPKKFKRTLRK